MTVQIHPDDLHKLVSHLDLPVSPNAAEVMIGGIKVWTSVLIPKGEVYLLHPTALPGVTKWTHSGLLEGFDFSDDGKYNIKNSNSHTWDPIVGQWRPPLVQNQISPTETSKWDPIRCTWNVEKIKPAPEPVVTEQTEMELLFESRNW